MSTCKPNAAIVDGPETNKNIVKIVKNTFYSRQKQQILHNNIKPYFGKDG